MVDLVISAELQQIVDSIAEFLDTELPVDRLRPHPTGGKPDAALWPAMGDLGWFMLALPEDLGGVGLTAVEEAQLFRHFGRHLLSPNVLASALGAQVAAIAGATDIAGAIASGRQRVTLANGRGAASVGDTVHGAFHLFDTPGCDWLLAIDEGGAAALLELDALTGLRPLSSAIDGLAIDDAFLAGVPAAMSVTAESGLHSRLRLLGAAMLAGVCEATCTLATEYAKLRVQFDQPIGAFQAIKHKCSDLAVRASAVGSLVDFAAIRVANDAPDAAFQATAAKLLGGQYALQNAKETIQVHGAMGFTTECNAHHFLKRAHVYDLIGGASRRQQQLLLLEPAPANDGEVRGLSHAPLPTGSAEETAA